MNPKQNIIFTDGASRGNPGPGGWGVVMIYKKSSSENHQTANERPPDKQELQVLEMGGREADTTNNRMELTAVIEALSQIQKSGQKSASIIIYTDSRYLINGITKWVYGWQRNGWQTKAKQEVLNRDLWQQLVEVSDDLDIDWQYVGGHSGVVGNERADEIATALADRRDPGLKNCPWSQYPRDLLKTDESGERSAEKSPASARRSGRPHSYVSLVDGRIKTHFAWSDCQARVHGVKGARYKKVFSLEEQKELMKKWSNLE